MAIHLTKRIALIAVLALLLVACGSGDSATDEVVAPATTAETEPTPVPTTEPIEAPAEESDAAGTDDSDAAATAQDNDETTDETADADTDGAAGSDATTATATDAADVAAAQSSGGATSTLAAVTSAQWSSNVSIRVDEASFQFSSNGYPSHELPDQFLVPADGNMPPFSDDDIDADFNIAETSDLIVESPLTEQITLTPMYSETVTLTSLGTIGVMISGVPLFNDYEDFGREFVALDDNLSLNGVYFIDACNGHPLASGLSYHYHGVPYCITDAVDVAGQHSTVIGFLLDGFPVYGSKDAGGATITSSQLDECSGHFGPTPEFPEGIYHYHLTEDVAPYSIDCFHGVVDYSAGGPGGAGGGPPGGGEGGPPEGAPPAGEEGAPPEGAPPAGEEGAPPEGAAPPAGEAGAPPQGAAPPDGGEGAPPEGGTGGPPEGGDGERPAGGGPGGGQGPDFATAAATLGITEDALRNAIGGPPPDFDAAAATLGISAAEIQAALDAAG